MQVQDGAGSVQRAGGLKSAWNGRLRCLASILRVLGATEATEEEGDVIYILTGSPGCQVEN